MFKKLVNKIKYIFKGQDDKAFEFESESIDYLPKDDEIAVDLASGEDITSVVVMDHEKEVQPKEKVFTISKVDKNTKRYILTAAYGEDKLPLIKILLRTRKPRVKKKLVKRIVNS